MLSLRGLVLFTVGLFIHLKSKSVVALQLSQDTFFVGNTKCEVLQYETMYTVIKEYYDNFTWMVDVAKEDNKSKDKVLTEIDTKVADYKTKHLDPLEKKFYEVKDAAKKIEVAFRIEEKDRRIIIRPHEDYKSKMTILGDFEKLEKEFEADYEKCKKEYATLFKEIYGKMGGRKSIVKQVLKHYHLTKFTELAGKALVLMAHARHDENLSTQRDTYYTAYTVGIVCLDDIKDVLHDNHQALEWTKTFIDAVKGNVKDLISKTDDSKRMSKDAIDKTKDDKATAKKTLKDIEKLEKEVKEEYKKIKAEFDKWKNALYDYYNAHIKDAKVDEEKATMEKVTSFIDTKIPKTWDGFFVHYVVVAAAAVAVSSIAKNGKSDL